MENWRHQLLRLEKSRFNHYFTFVHFIMIVLNISANIMNVVSSTHMLTSLHAIYDQHDGHSLVLNCTQSNSSCCGHYNLDTIFNQYRTAYTIFYVVFVITLVVDAGLIAQMFLLICDSRLIDKDSFAFTLLTGKLQTYIIDCIPTICLIIILNQYESQPLGIYCLKCLHSAHHVAQCFNLTLTWISNPGLYLKLTIYGFTTTYLCIYFIVLISKNGMIILKKNRQTSSNSMLMYYSNFFLAIVSSFMIISLLNWPISLISWLHPLRIPPLLSSVIFFNQWTRLVGITAGVAVIFYPILIIILFLFTQDRAISNCNIAILIVYISILLVPIVNIAMIFYVFIVCINVICQDATSLSRVTPDSYLIDPDT